MPMRRPLTQRQHLILRHVGRGLTNKEIAEELGISEQGVKVHISRLLERYGASNRVELVGRTRAWSDAEDRSYAALSADLAGLRDGLAREGSPSSSMGEMRSMRSTFTTFGPSDAPNDIVQSVATMRDLLTEVDVAVKLARELPAEAASGPLVDAIRTRVRAAIAESDRLAGLIALRRELSTASRRDAG